MKRAFLICPVRGGRGGESQDDVLRLEQIGYEVHWPPRDTPQNDSVGLEICRNNMKAISRADVVFVVYDENSKGTHFDLGMAFALKKKIILIRTLSPDISGKSFVKVMLAIKNKKTY